MSGTRETQSKSGRPGAIQPEGLIGRTLRNGDYKIGAVLGQGGMGEVFLGSHTTLQIPLALKRGRADRPLPEMAIAELNRLLHSDTAVRHASTTNTTSTSKLTEQNFPLGGGTYTDRFLREALLLARLQHASLPMLYDYFVENGYWYLVMDYIPGPNLSTYIYKHAPLPPLEALNYAMQLCDVLEYLHQQSPPVIFRDLKPSNIILSPDGRVMLVDFGIARYFKVGQMNDTTELGSPGYAPPEQYKGEGQTDARSDLYSLGVILHEMLSGQRPVGMGEKLESLHYINHAISSVLSGLVTVATRVEAMYRFQSAHIFYRALERAYAIEERRAYQQGILVTQGNEPFQWSSLQTFASPLEGQAHDIFQPTLDMQQRQQTREALQEARHDRIEQEHAELHMASIDESLQRRSSIGFTPLPPLLEDEEYEQYYEEQEEDALLPPHPRSPSSKRTRRVIQAIFGIVLVVFLITASLHISDIFPSHRQSVSQSQSTPMTPTSVITQSDSWHTLPSLPSPEADNTSVYVEVQGRAYIYMSGGFRGPRQSPLYDHHLYRYDIAAAHWEMLAPTYFPGMVNNAVARDEQNHLFFTAGYSSDVYAIASLLYMYQPATGILQKIIPPSSVLIGFGAAMISDQHGHLYITQGFMRAADPHAIAGTTWYRYDISTGQWHTLAPLPISLGYVVLAPDDADNILLLGGSRDAGQHLPTQQIYRYNIAHNTWTTEQTTSPVPLTGASNCLNGPQQLIIVGGYDPIHNKTSGQTWLVDLHTLRWIPLKPLPSGGSLLGTAACDGNGHVFLTRGANDPSQPTADFWELTIT